MNIVTSIIRIAILLALASVAMAALFALPADDCSIGYFLLSIAITKGIALAGFMATHRLYGLWKNTDPLISRYDRKCASGLDTPNRPHLDRGKEGE